MTRVAIITGGGQGMGAAAAAAFLRDGFAGVVLVDRNASGLVSCEAKLAAPGRVATVTADLMEKATPGMAVAAAMEKFGRVDVLVNAAGTSERCSIDDVTHEAFERIFTVNVRAPVFMMQEAARAMRKTGGGVVINISSMLAYGGPPDIGIYASSKAALVAATRNAANAWKAQGIRVFAINLGWVNSEGEHALQTGFHKQPQNWAELAGQKVPFGRLIAPADVGGVCSFLVSPPAQMMTGAIIDYEQMPIGTYDFHPMVARD
jgi:NAD(P)-dependent dehydrogenase (short-subunit alcohol dehydrogenase family)